MNSFEILPKILLWLLSKVLESVCCTTRRTYAGKKGRLNKRNDEYISINQSVLNDNFNSLDLVDLFMHRHIREFCISNTANNSGVDKAYSTLRLSSAVVFCIWCCSVMLLILRLPWTNIECTAHRIHCTIYTICIHGSWDKNEESLK